MTDFVVEPSFLVDVLWQTTALLGIGLIGARLARRAARGHVVLLLALMAAVLAPLITASFRALGWGLWDALALPTLTDAVVPPTEMGRAATAGSGLGWAEIVLLGWITVSAIALTRLVTSIVRGQRLLVDSNEADPAFAGAARDVARRLSLSCAPEIRESDHVACPVIWCWGRQPRILLPGGTPAEDARRLTGMLCHELAHWKRGDHRAALATELALCFLPWHPLAWRARARLRELSEHACDDWVLAAGETPAVYAEALLGLVVRPHPALALAAMSTERGFGRRVRRILETHDAGGVRPAPGARWMLLATLAAGVIVATVAAAHRREPPFADPDPAPAATGIAVEIMPPLPTVTAGLALNAVVVPAELDLGSGSPDVPKPGTAWIVNMGTAPANLLDVKTSCGCTTVKGFRPGPLAPGASIQLQITMTAPAAGTHKTKTVTFVIEGQDPIELPVHLDGSSSPSSAT